MPIGILLSFVAKVWALDSLTDFNSRSTLWNGTLTNPEDIASSSPVVSPCTGTESIISWSQKKKTEEADTLLP